MSVRRLGDDLCESTAIRERIRRHPIATMGLGALAGVALGPLLVRALPRLFGTVALVRGLVPKSTSLLPRVAADAIRSLGSVHRDPR